MYISVIIMICQHASITAAAQPISPGIHVYKNEDNCVYLRGAEHRCANYIYHVICFTVEAR